ncbi:MAG: hypothetical protein HYX67_13230 [Candidatus Melainabacteria bacterium]|nr:hypothetical protein [Candidatus Melainabacteria bacterium]
MGRLADLAFAEVKTQLYRTSIAWDLVTSPSTEKALVLDDVVSLSLDATSTKKFRRKAFLYSVGKKGKAGEEYRLATCEITLQPYEEKRKNKRERTFTYQVLLKKTSNISVETPPQTNIPPLPTQSKSG